MLNDRTHSAFHLADPALRDRALPGLRLARSSRRVRLFGRLLLGGLALAFAAMLLAPWIQTVAGSGSVVAYDPQNRQQVVQAPIEGNIARWAEGIRENAFVEEGDFVVELADVDPELLSRLSRQRSQAADQVQLAESAREAAQRGVIASQSVVESNNSQLVFLQEALRDTLDALDREIEGSQQKVKAEEQALAKAQATLVQARADHDRQLALFKEGFAAQAKFQEAEQKYLGATADVAKHEAYLEDARLAVQAKQSLRPAKERELQAKIDEVRAKVRKSESDVAKAESDLQKASSEIAKANSYLLDAESKLAKQRRQEVYAPRSGIVTQLISDGGSGIVKKGDPLFVLVPDGGERAVQIWLDGNDAPLVNPGRKVRLQFEGWPAVQFAGWPSVAVGTFGGEVASVDAVDDGMGRFRVLVTPDPEDDPWPEDRFLRQGVRANGWVLLNEVALGYEMWRRMNGFPPVLTDAPAEKAGGKGGGGLKPVNMGKGK
ncbi:HlyD family secretion protein [Alienimonas californiensis]|uniref:Hemolysin secretion protein D, chromosomal n=1 Tax=Alienimonas californiensis TaxID=2527989 RepID=A0A517P5H5_9PLAN|nr:toxin secretion protein [Alienimonas californiensis]QDT14630.1 Hemolysin secretion protein D, chromosomal [Alienimonas californiensis]